MDLGHVHFHRLDREHGLVMQSVMVSGRLTPLLPALRSLSRKKWIERAVSKPHLLIKHVKKLAACLTENWKRILIPFFKKG